MKFKEIIENIKNNNSLAKSLETDYANKNKGSIYHKRYQLMVFRKNYLENKLINYGKAHVNLWAFNLIDKYGVVKKARVYYTQELEADEVSKLIELSTGCKVKDIKQLKNLELGKIYK